MTDNISRMYELAVKSKKLNWDTMEFKYPPFTDTKQLELIKYFSENIDFLELSHNGEEFEFYTSGSRDRNKDFSQALASFIYYKWEDLTDEQKEQIKRILE